MLLEAGAAHHRGHADLLDRVRMHRREAAEEIGADLDDDHVADGDDGRRSRLAGQQRHLAEIPAALDARHLLAPGLEHDADAPEHDDEHRLAGFPLPDDRLAAAVDRHRRRRRDLLTQLGRQRREQIHRATAAVPARAYAPRRSSCGTSFAYWTWIGHGISMPWRWKE